MNPLIDVVDNSQDEVAKIINTALAKHVKLMEQKHMDDEYPWIVFTLDNTEYAISAKHVQSVAVLYAVVPYADALAYCPGVMWDSFGIIRLLDLRALLGQVGCMLAGSEENGRLPMIIIVEPDGKRLGLIVDKIVAMKHVNALAEVPANDEYIQSRYVSGSIGYDYQKKPAQIISPENFPALEFEWRNAKIDWKGQVDMRMKTDNQ